MIQKYGLREGIRLTGTVIPSILSDFDGELRTASFDHVISEEYMLDDRTAKICMKGIRNKKDQRIVTQILIDGKEIYALRVEKQ